MSLFRILFAIIISVLGSHFTMGQESEENFETFLKRFDTDSLFQLSRLLDSVTVEYSSDIIIDDDGNGYTENYESRVAKTDWRVISLENKKHTDWDVNELEKDVKQLIMVGRQSGVYVAIEFILFNGLWVLRKYGDYST